jgi:CBS domain-containing protein
MYIRDLMTHSVITAPPTMSLALAQRLMHDHRIRHLPVAQGSQLVGLVTDRDLRQALPSSITTLTPDEITFYVATFVKPFRALFASLVSYTTHSTNERILIAAASEVAVHLA